MPGARTEADTEAEDGAGDAYQAYQEKPTAPDIVAECEGAHLLMVCFELLCAGHQGGVDRLQARARAAAARTSSWWRRWLTRLPTWRA